jgi:thioredoxin-like negative regulator of GroEL
VRIDRNRLRVLALCMLATTVSGVVAGEAPFLDDPRQAFDTARRQERPLLIAFRTTWCEACERMDRTTWQDPSVVRSLETAFVALSVDGERNANLTGRYDVAAYPTIVIADAEGRPLLHLLGYRSAEQMTAYLTDVARHWDDLAVWSVRAAGRRPDPSALAALGDFARGHRDYARAERCYRKTLRSRERLDPQRVRETRISLARTLAATDRCKEARKTLADLDTHDLDDATLRLLDEARTRCPV